MTRVDSAFKWSLASVIAVAIAQIAVTAATSRLLAPEAFGLMAVANVIVRFVSYFAQAGVGPAVIQTPDLSRRYIAAATTLSVAVGLVSALLLALFAAPVANAFAMPQATDIIRAMSVVFVFMALSSVPLGILKRELDYRGVAMIEIGAFLVGNLGVTVTLAWLGWGAWSLVAGLITYQAVTTVAALALAWSTASPGWSRDYGLMKRIAAFGSHFSLNTIGDFLFFNVDVWAISRFFGQKDAGIFNRAYMLATLPTYQLVNSMTRVLFPAFSRLQNDHDALQESYDASLFAVAMTTLAPTVGMVIAAPELVLSVLGRKWAEAVVPFQILAIAVPFTFIGHVQEVLVDARGHLKQRTAMRFAGLVVKVAGMLLAIPYGMAAVLWASTAATVIQLVITTVALRGSRIAAARASGLAIPVLSAVVVGAMALPVTLLLRGWRVAPLAALPVQILVCAAGLLVSVRLSARSMPSLVPAEARSLPLMKAVIG